MKVRAAASLLFLACLLPLSALAQQKKDFGDYVVHYSAFTADFLQPEVAQAYGIRRSPSRAVLNVVVARKEDGKEESITADIKGSAVNLNEQFRRLHMRKVVDGDAIYYLAEFPVTNKEVLDFTLNITPEGTSRNLGVQFRQQFFTEKPPQ